ncbi:MAG: tRNA (adenosine(37)-N6)-threonylcarbamoyltransferase complex dimerization subunit type 1 TsaB [Pseudomonas fluorescens]|nr:MAG: tRNA (adenosine(37)-N6)-threonylcarbamoyltransferase complex dimerization subunit type 1 TsaB [Pseudomonas fluorescens]
MPTPDVQLALDCSFTGLAIAVRTSTQTFTFSTSIPRSSDILPTELQSLLAQAQATVADIRRIIVTTGPGSFTGIRLGLATAEAFKLLNPAIEIIGVSTLQALATQITATHAPTTGFTLALDAAGGQAYVQSFAPDATPTSEATCVAFTEVPADTRLFASPSLLMESTPITELSATHILTLAENEARHLPPQPVYLKPLTYKKQG